MKEVFGGIKKRQRNHDGGKPQHQGQHHLGENEHDACHEAEQTQEDESNPAQNCPSHPAHAAADCVQVLAELRNEFIELCCKIGCSCPATADRRDQSTSHIVQATDNGVRNSIKVGPVEGKQPDHGELHEIPKKAGPIHASELESHVDADADQRQCNHQQDDRAGIARNSPKLRLGRIGKEPVRGSDHPADNTHYQLPCASQRS